VELPQHEGERPSAPWPWQDIAAEEREARERVGAPEPGGARSELIEDIVDRHVVPRDLGAHFENMWTAQPLSTIARMYTPLSASNA